MITRSVTIASKMWVCFFFLKKKHIINEEEKTKYKTKHVVANN